MTDLYILQLETTNHCNAHCTFCPHDRFTEKGFMSDELYDKILSEARELPHLTKIIPMLTGEPFLDKKFVSRLRKLRETFSCAIEVYTNGSLLTEELVSQLKEIPAIEYSVSLNGLKRETRRRLMGLDDYQQVRAGLRAMERAGIRYRPTMVFAPEVTDKEARDFFDAGGMVIKYQSWAGLEYPFQRTCRTSCGRALRDMTVRYNGDVVLCCFDPFGKVTFGNLNRETIEEVWTSERHRNYQRMHALGRGNELPLCDQCTEGLTMRTG